MGAYNDIFIKRVLDSITLAASASHSSDALDLGNINQSGLFSLQVALTGDGTAKIEYELSNDGRNYITPTTAIDISTAFTKTSGPGSNGQDILSFEPELARFMKIKVTETGGADSITITTHIASQ